MNTKAKNEIVVLAVLVGLLSISVYSQISRRVRSQPDAPAVNQRLQSQASSKPTEVVQVELLENSTPKISGVKRNIFQFGGMSGGEESEAPVLRIPQTQPVFPVAPALPDVHYLGFYLEKETGLMLAAIVNGGKIYVGKVGQTLAGKYELIEIAPDHVIVRLIGDGKILRIPLGKGPANVVNRADLNSGDQEGQ